MALIILGGGRLEGEKEEGPWKREGRRPKEVRGGMKTECGQNYVISWYLSLVL